MFKKFIISLIAGCGFVTASANAAVIVVDFEEATEGAIITDTYTENGVSFDPVQGAYDIFTNGSIIFNARDSAGLVVIDITFSGGTFDLLSFDIMNLTNVGAFTLTSNLGDSFAIPAAIGMVNFATTFIGVTTLTLTQNFGGSLQLDNFTINSVNGSPVPLPAALPLMIAGIAGLGAMTRRRRKAA
ncbi:MAG: VPLPA-CTERM sorting domain-containing protein [Parvularculaceae bacterium]